MGQSDVEKSTKSAAALPEGVKKKRARSGSPARALQRICCPLSTLRWSRYEIESSRHTCPCGASGLNEAFPEPDRHLSMHPALPHERAHLRKVSNDYPSRITRDCGPSPCERCYRLLGMGITPSTNTTTLSRLRLVIQPTYPEGNRSSVPA